MIKRQTCALTIALVLTSTAYAENKNPTPPLEPSSVQFENTPEYDIAVRSAAEAETLLGMCAGQQAESALSDSEKVDLILLIRADYARGLRAVQKKLGDLPDGQTASYGVFTDVLKLKELGCGDKAETHIEQGYTAAQALSLLAEQVPEDRQSAVRKVLGGAVGKVINTVFTHLHCLEGGDHPQELVNPAVEAFRPFFNQQFDADVNKRSFVAMFQRHPMQFAYFDKLEAQARIDSPDNPVVDKSCGPRPALWEAVKDAAASLAKNTPDHWKLDTALESEL